MSCYFMSVIFSAPKQVSVSVILVLVFVLVIKIALLSTILDCQLQMWKFDIIRPYGMCFADE